MININEKFENLYFIITEELSFKTYYRDNQSNIIEVFEIYKDNNKNRIKDINTLYDKLNRELQISQYCFNQYEEMKESYKNIAIAFNVESINSKEDIINFINKENSQLFSHFQDLEFYLRLILK